MGICNSAFDLRVLLDSCQPGVSVGLTLRQEVEPNLHRLPLASSTSFNNNFICLTSIPSPTKYFGIDYPPLSLLIQGYWIFN